MPLVMHIDTQGGVAKITATGTITGPEICSMIQALYADPRFQPGMAELWDLRLAHAPISVADIQDIVATGQRGTATRGAGKTAIVAATNLEYGLARVLQVYAEVVPVVEVEVF